MCFFLNIRDNNFIYVNCIVNFKPYLLKTLRKVYDRNIIIDLRQGEFSLHDLQSYSMVTSPNIFVKFASTNQNLISDTWTSTARTDRLHIHWSPGASPYSSSP